MKWASLLMGLVAVVALAAPASAGHPPLGPRPGFYPQAHGHHGHPSGCCCSSCCGPRYRSYPRPTYYPPYYGGYGYGYGYGRRYYPSYRYPYYSRGGIGIRTNNFGFQLRF